MTLTIPNPLLILYMSSLPTSCCTPHRNISRWPLADNIVSTKTGNSRVDHLLLLHNKQLHEHPDECCKETSIRFCFPVTTVSIRE